MFGVSRTSLALPLLVRSWSFALGASWRQEGNGQSNAEVCSHVSCSPKDWPDDMIQKLATINLHHVWSRWSHDIDTDRLEEHGLVTLPQAAILVDQGWRDWTQFELEDIGYINAVLLPHD